MLTPPARTSSPQVGSQPDPGQTNRRPTLVPPFTPCVTVGTSEAIDHHPIGDFMSRPLKDRSVLVPLLVSVVLMVVLVVPLLVERLSPSPDANIGLGLLLLAGLPVLVALLLWVIARSVYLSRRGPRV